MHIAMKRLFRACLACFLSAAPVLAQADDLPPFRKGMWEFTRSVESGAGPAQKISRKECASPSDDMMKDHAAGMKDCTFTPVKRSGKVYSYAVKCDFGGVAILSKSVMTVDSDSAYRIQIESEGGGQKGKELLVARRLGDC